MKRHLLFLFCLSVFGISAIAQNPPTATTRCKIPGTDYGYVTVDYYNGGSGAGSVVFANQSNITITRMHIKITVEDIWYEEETYYNQYLQEKRTETRRKKRVITLCDDVFENIPFNRSEVRTSSQRGPVKGGTEKEGHTYTYKVIIVDDPICKPE